MSFDRFVKDEEYDFGMDVRVREPDMGRHQSTVTNGKESERQPRRGSAASATPAKIRQGSGPRELVTRRDAQRMQESSLRIACGPGDRA